MPIIWFEFPALHSLLTHSYETLCSGNRHSFSTFVNHTFRRLDSSLSPCKKQIKFARLLPFSESEERRKKKQKIFSCFLTGQGNDSISGVGFSIFRFEYIRPRLHGSTRPCEGLKRHGIVTEKWFLSSWKSLHSFFHVETQFYY